MISNSSAAGQWIYLQTLTFAGDSNKTASSLPAYSKYYILFDNVVGSTTLDVYIQLNGYAGTAYTCWTGNGTTITQVNSASALIIGGTNAQLNNAGQIIIQGKASTTTPYYIFSEYNSFSMAVKKGFGGYVAATSGEQINSIKVLTSTGNLTTGTFKIYGAN